MHKIYLKKRRGGTFPPDSTQLPNDTPRSLLEYKVYSCTNEVYVIGVQPRYTYIRMYVYIHIHAVKYDSEILLN